MIHYLIVGLQLLTLAALVVLLVQVRAAQLAARCAATVAASARAEAQSAAGDAELAAELSRRILHRLQAQQELVAADLAESHERADAVLSAEPGAAADAAASSPISPQQ